MASFDIDKQEIKAIIQAVELSDKKILEIGCGTGRLTGQLAPLCGSIVAIDPDEVNIETAMVDNTFTNTTYQVGSATDLPFADEAFDTVIFSLSLCCVEPKEKMREAVLEAVRVLLTGGHLLNLMPSTTRNFDAGWMWYYIDEEEWSQVFDMWVASARMALKKAVFVDREISFVKEVKIATRWSYDNIDEMRDRWLSRYEETHGDQSDWDPAHRATFEQQLEQYAASFSLIWDMYEEMQVLRK